MTWLLLALAAPLLFAITNFADKYLIEHYAKSEEGSSVGSLALFSSLFAVLVIPIFLLFDIPSDNLSVQAIWILITTGVVYLGSIILYLYALNDDDVSNVIPFWLTAPLFDFILAKIFLGEQLSRVEIFSGLLILIGAALLTVEQDDSGKVRIKWNLAFLMLLSSALLAINDLLFKKTAVEAGFWDSFFWTYAGYGILGIILFCVIKSYRHEFIKLLKKSGSVILGVNIGGEVLMIAGDAALRFATLLAPLAIVQSVSDGFQPVYTFIGGVALTLWFPSIISESIDRRHLMRKTAALVAMVVGLFFLAL